MTFVIDASVVLAWQFRDESNVYADGIVARLTSENGIVPAVWPLEVGNALLVAQRRGRITPEDAKEAFAIVLQLPVSVHEAVPERLLTSVWEAASSHALSMYDAAYLDLARQAAAPLATADERLRSAAEAVGVAVI